MAQMVTIRRGLFDENAELTTTIIAMLEIDYGIPVDRPYNADIKTVIAVCPSIDDVLFLVETQLHRTIVVTKSTDTAEFDRLNPHKVLQVTHGNLGETIGEIAAILK